MLTNETTLLNCVSGYFNYNPIFFTSTVARDAGGAVWCSAVDPAGYM